MSVLIKNGHTYSAVSTFCTDNLATPLVLSVPHSGEVYPDDFNPHPDLPYEEYDRPADRFVDELFDNFRDLHIPMVKAEFARVYVDVNRRQYDLPEEIIRGKWDSKIARTTGTTMIWADIYGTPTYNRKLSVQEVRNRIGKCYIPYHQILTTVIQQTRQKYGVVYLLDCHSMAEFDADTGKQRPEIDIGTRGGVSCDTDIAQFLKQAFEDKGYVVGMNARFAGGEITQRYGYPEYNQHALQIEFRRDLYMNEDSRKPTEKFATLQHHCRAVLSAYNTFLNNR